MENKLNFGKFEDFFARPFVLAFLLVIVCFLLHFSVLSQGWRHDDGPHLHFVTTFSPWQYFFIPEVMRQQSYAHFTPWNAFFYEIGLPFFGFNPTGYYIHLLLVIWLTSLATYHLLRLWVGFLAALLAAVMFLVMPATAAVAQMLMTGHYAYGLLFTVLSIYYFVRAIRENNLYFSLGAALFYGLACWCKELYVPLIGVLVFFPESDFKTRMRHMYLFWLIALIYTVYRFVVLQGVGGYSESINFDFSASIFNVIGNNWLLFLWAVYFAVSIFMLVYKKRHIKWVFFLSCLVVIYVPICNFLGVDFVSDVNLRFLFFFSWFLVVLLGLLAENNRLKIGFLFFLALNMVLFCKGHDKHVDRLETVNRFIYDEGHDGFFLVKEVDAYGYLDSIIKAFSTAGEAYNLKLLDGEFDLISLGEEIGSNVFNFDDSCRCVKKIGLDKYRQLVTDFRSKLVAGENKPMRVFFEVEKINDVRSCLHWKISAPDGKLVMHVRNNLHVTVPASGNHCFGNDYTFRTNSSIRMAVELHSPEGWIARAPELELSTNHEGSRQFVWEGSSVSTIFNSQ